ncbi:MAG: zf-HC2 domain-containing protein [Phycisphaerae bacterium]|nr:zf-HC2 domain-containing protein [Phycisphaerae bacterium]
MSGLSCKEFIDFLDDYVAATQSPSVRASFEEHLAICPYCADYLRTYTEAVRLGRAVLVAGAGSVPAEVPDELVQAIIEASRRRSS